MLVDKGRKMLIGLMLILFGMIIAAQGVYADNIRVGDWIKLADVPGRGNTNGGEFALSQSATKTGSYSYEFNTFCMEKDEYFNYGEALYVSGISKKAWAGGINSDIGDDLDKKTAYLYYNFRMGLLDDLTSANIEGQRYEYNKDAGANSLQQAIWFIEGEGGPTNYLVVLAGGASVDALDLAFAHVSVLNLTNGPGGQTLKQDQLTLVPEPGTLLLLGFGLIGLVGYRKTKA